MKRSTIDMGSYRAKAARATMRDVEDEEDAAYQAEDAYQAEADDIDVLADEQQEQDEPARGLGLEKTRNEARRVLDERRRSLERASRQGAR